MRHALCRLADLTDGRLTCVPPEGDPVLVLAEGGGVHVIDALCPHQYAPLQGGPIADGVLTCPHHGWRFTLATGVSPDSPCLSVTRHKAWVEDGVVWMELP